MNFKEIQREWLSYKDVNEVLFPSVSVIQSRYDTKVRMVMSTGEVTIRPIRRLDVFIPYSNNDIYYIVKNSEQYRPDILALRFYNDPRMYWVILSANDMKTVFEFESGKNIRIPAYETVYSQGGVMMR